MKAGFVQFEPLFGEIDKNLEKVEMLIKDSEANLLVLPELFNTGYLFTSKDEVVALAESIPEGKTTQALCRLAKTKNIHIVGGLVERYEDKIYNSAVIVSPEGFVGKYRKVHLFFEEKLWFDGGDGGFEVYDLGDIKIGVMICFDWFFPEAMRVLTLKGAQIICHCANLILPFCPEAMKTRCLENRVFAITSNRVGVEKRGGKALQYIGMSQIVAPNSDILYRAGEATEELGMASIDTAQANDKKINKYNHLIEDRMPDFYRAIIGK